MGAVVDGESVWLYDAEHERWVYCDGKQLSTYAASQKPGGAEEGGAEEGGAEDSEVPGPEPTQIVDPARLPGPSPGGPLGQDRAGASPEPTQVVGPEAGGTGPPEPASATGPEPTQVVDPARLVPPTGDAPDPHPPTRPGEV